MYFTRYLIVYDIADSKRLNELRKLLEGFVYWKQNSVFEGELTKSQFVELKDKIRDIIEKDEDSVIIYPLTKQNVENKIVIGVEKRKVEFVI